MDTKLKKYKGWTSRLPVKIICTALIPVMMITAMYYSSEVMQLPDKSIDLLGPDLTVNDYFFDYYVPHTSKLITKFFLMQSEENIKNHGCLKWDKATHTFYDDNIQLVTENGYTLQSTVEDMRYSQIVVDINSQEAQQFTADAVESQLRDFEYFKFALENTYGLFWYITDGSRQAGNVPAGTTADFFRSQPVFLLAERGTPEASRVVFSYDASDFRSDLTLYIAFSEEAAVTQNALWKHTQNQLISCIILVLTATAAGLACGLIILLGAGRRYGSDTGEIYFAFYDSPWLDISFILLVFYEQLIIRYIAELIIGSEYFGSRAMLLTVCAVLSVLFSLPLIGWASSFAKHVKAKKWLRHTFVCKLLTVLHRWFRLLFEEIPLNLRVFLISGAVFLMNILFMFASPSEQMLAVSFLIFVLVLIMLLKYSRRLFLVEQAAKKASEGQYGTEISVTGGSLGSIAASIARISDSVNIAVSESVKSERFKTELITNVSHDIRTPLTSLITYGDLLRNEGLDSKRAPEYLDVIIQKSARLKTLTDDLFEASKAFSGNIEVRMENLDLADCVRQVLGEMDEKVSGSGLDFRLDIPDHAPVLADGKLLWRVMENLLSNVFKYALRNSRVYIDIVPEDGKYRLNMKNISDQPLNVEPSELLERFKRGDDSRSGDGSGLGLSIAQNFIDAQGGQLEISVDGDLFKASFCLKAQQ